VNEKKIEIDKEKIGKTNQCDGNGDIKVNEEEKQSKKRDNEFEKKENIGIVNGIKKKIRKL